MVGGRAKGVAGVTGRVVGVGERVSGRSRSATRVAAEALGPGTADALVRLRVLGRVD
jgi:hypothetical protein